MIKQTKPILNAMLICDRVITEEGTNKKSLIGIFENISAKSFPCIHHSLSVYIKLTDANGRYRFSLELFDLEEEKITDKTEIPDEIEIRDPLRTHELVFNLVGLKLTHPGKYEFRIYANGENFGQKSFMVSQLSEGLKNA